MLSPPDTKADGITNVDEATAHCVKFATALGYPYMLFTVRFPAYNGESQVILTNFPRAWIQRFADGEISQDPLFVRISRRVQPFAWDELPPSAFGLVDGADPVLDFKEAWTSPLWFGPGFRASMTVAGSRVPPAGEDRDTQYAFGLLFASRMADRLKRLFEEARPTEKLEQLRTREREVLELVSRGVPIKTVAAKLNMSKRAAEKHLHAAQRRLQVATREQAIARAVSVGEVGLVSFPANVDLFGLTAG